MAGVVMLVPEQILKQKFVLKRQFYSEFFVSVSALRYLTWSKITAFSSEVMHHQRILIRTEFQLKDWLQLLINCCWWNWSKESSAEKVKNPEENRKSEDGDEKKSDKAKMKDNESGATGISTTIALIIKKSQYFGVIY